MHDEITGEKLKQIREASGLSQMEFAVRLGVAGSALSNWERGKTPISPKSQAAIRKALEANHPLRQPAVNSESRALRMRRNAGAEFLDLILELAEQGDEEAAEALARLTNEIAKAVGDLHSSKK